MYFKIYTDGIWWLAIVCVCVCVVRTCVCTCMRERESLSVYDLYNIYKMYAR